MLPDRARYFSSCASDGQFLQVFAGGFTFHIANDAAAFGTDAKIRGAAVFDAARLLQNIDGNAKLGRRGLQHIVDGRAVGKFGGAVGGGDGGNSFGVVANPVHGAGL